MKTSVIIVGGGLAGLTCAVELERRGVEYRLLEAGSRVGGRVVTDQVDGFLLDRGFQVLLTGYPEIRRLWAMENLRLRRVRSGAVIHQGGKWLTLPDPLRHPSELLAALRSPVASWMDKVRLALLAFSSLGNNADNSFGGASQTTLQYLQRCGFSRGMIETFWRPFLGGVFLDWDLNTGSDLFRFLFPMFAWGRVAVPAGGMQQLPLQLERRLNPGRVVLGTRVEKLEGTRCWDQSGQLWEGDQLVVALDGTSADQLLGEESKVRWAGSCTTYFAAPRSIGGRGRLHLNADGANSCIQHLICLSDVAQEYAPAGQHLISVTSLFGAPTEDELRGQLQEWFGAGVVEWRMLRQDFLPQSLPALAPATRPRQLQVGGGVWRCGDYTAYPSLNAAVASGRSVAESLGYGEPK